MNNRQKTALILGLFGIVATGLYPPWTIKTILGFGPLTYKYTVEHSFLFAPPVGTPNTHGVSLDVSVLLTIWVVVLAITFGLVLLFGLERKAPKTTSDSARAKPDE